MVTLVVPQPVGVPQVTVPDTSCDFTRPLCPFTRPYWPLMAAVNVTGWPKPDGVPLEVTTVVVFAPAMLKLLVCELLELV